MSTAVTTTPPRPLPHTTLPPVEFVVPMQNPRPGGLLSQIRWASTDDDVPRWLASGVQFRNRNTGLDLSIGQWDVPTLCGDPGEQRKRGHGRTDDPQPFTPLTLWASDDCDTLADSQTETRERVLQAMRLHTEQFLETHLAGRLGEDAAQLDNLPTVSSIVDAVAWLDEQITVAAITAEPVLHAAPRWRAHATAHNLYGQQYRVLPYAPNDRWCFGGGYALGLGDVIVATTPIYGWRSTATVHDDVLGNTEASDDRGHTTVVEQSFVVGYERLIGAVRVA